MKIASGRSFTTTACQEKAMRQFLLHDDPSAAQRCRVQRLSTRLSGERATKAAADLYIKGEDIKGEAQLPCPQHINSFAKSGYANRKFAEKEPNEIVTPQRGAVRGLFARRVICK